MEVVRETGLTFSYSLSTVFVYYFILYLVYTIGVRRKSPAFLATVLHVSLSLSLPSIIAGRGGRRCDPGSEFRVGRRDRRRCAKIMYGMKKKREEKKYRYVLCSSHQIVVSPPVRYMLYVPGYDTIGGQSNQGCLRLCVRS